MWVFIRPGVVRSANGERLIWGGNSVQFIVSMRTISFCICFGSGCSTRSGASGSEWNRPASAANWTTEGLRLLLAETKCLCIQARRSSHLNIPGQFPLSLHELRQRR